MKILARIEKWKFKKLIYCNQSCFGTIKCFRHTCRNAREKMKTSKNLKAKNSTVDTVLDKRQKFWKFYKIFGS